MRKFYIENAIGERVGLNGEAGIWLQDPAGLGMILEGSFADLGSGFFADITGDTEPQGEVAGNLVFFKNGDQYQNYADFVDWVNRGYALYLVYDPYGREFYRLVKIKYLTKTEKVARNRLEVPAAFACLTPWFLLTPFRASISHGSTGYKRYPYTYPYRYPASRQAGAVTVQATGHQPAAFSLTYTGLLTTPSIILRGVQSGVVYGQCDIADTLEATDKLIYSSEINNSRVRKQAADGTITDLIGAVDVSKEVYGRIPLAEPCTISLVSSTAVANNAEVKVYNYLRSV